MLAAAILTIALNPISFSVARPVAELLCKHFRFARTAAARLDPQSTMPDEVESKKTSPSRCHCRIFLYWNEMSVKF